MSGQIIVDELEIEVPYGKLKAKTWHQETDNCKRVLAIHGWMDNAGSFDNLMPHLKHPDGLYVVGLDLPGHGRSSQLPAGCKYDEMVFVVELRRLVSHLNWHQEANDDEGRKFTILGHSLGAVVGLFYASLYPNEVESVIMIDLIKGKTKPASEMLEDLATTMDEFLQLMPANNSSQQEDRGQVVVSHETAIVATIEAHKPLGILTKDGAMCLLERSTVAKSIPPNSVVYSRDLRLKFIIQLRDHWKMVKLIFESLKCHVLCILAKEGLCKTDPHVKDHLDDIIEFVDSRAKSFHLQWAEGDHFLHITKPEEIASDINGFLDSPNDYKISSDR